MVEQLQPNAPQALLKWLHAHGLWRDVQACTVETAGDGNMNVVLRARSTRGTLIVKQSRPFVAKYPQIAAPSQRTESEAAWYAAIASAPAVSRATPTVLLHDTADHVLVMEDLGPTTDRMDLYAGGLLDDETHEAVLAWMAALHTVRVLPSMHLRNRAMRALNAAHIFVVPFQPGQDDTLDALTPGLGQLSAATRDRPGLQRRIGALHARYLADGTTLLHGDLYPGSVVRSARGVVLLDPEFGFLGDPAIDRGVWAGHMVLAGQPAGVVHRALRDAPPGTEGFAGVEILRRLLGVAQLPLTADLPAKAAMIEQAVSWIEA